MVVFSCVVLINFLLLQFALLETALFFIIEGLQVYQIAQNQVLTLTA